MKFNHSNQKSKNYKPVYVTGLCTLVTAASLLIQPVSGEMAPEYLLSNQNLSFKPEPGNTLLAILPGSQAGVYQQTFGASQPNGQPASMGNMPGGGMPAQPPPGSVPSPFPPTGRAPQAGSIADPSFGNQSGQPRSSFLHFPVFQPMNRSNGGKIVLRTGIETTQKQDIELTIGKAIIVNTGVPVSRVSISDPAIASALVLSPTQIQLVGGKVGVANMLLWTDPQSNQYTAVDLSVHRDVSSLSKQLQLLDPNIRVTPLVAEDTVILSGDVESRESAQLAMQLANAYFSKNASGSAVPPSSNAAGPGSLTPGSSTPGAVMPNIINMLKIKGQPTTKLGLLQEKLKQIDPNINADLVPGPNGEEKVMLTGRVRSPGVISNAINTASIMYGKPGLLVVTGPGGNMVKPNSGNNSFQTNDAFSSNIDTNILQGSVVTDASGNVVSMMTVARKPQIRCSIKFLDVSRTALKQLGNSVIGGDSHGNGYGSFSGAQNPATGKTVAAYGGSGGFTTLGNGLSRTAGGDALNAISGLGQTLGTGITQIFTLRNNLSIGISALEEKLKARSLAEPTITMLSGEKSSFLAGGEVPIPVLGTMGNISVTYHEYGIRLNIIATVTEDGKIHMQFAPEISTVDLSLPLKTNVVQIPAFKTRRMQSTLELKDGESFVLAGLFSQDETTSASQFPVLGDIPIIGNFLKNKWKQKNDDEMIVIIKPEVVMTPNSEGFSPQESGKIQEDAGKTSMNR